MTKPLIDFDFGRPKLVWGVHAVDGQVSPIDDCEPRPGGLRWLHLNLADQPTRDWIAACQELPDDIRALLLDRDADQRALVEGDAIGFVLHDFERGFDAKAATGLGVLRFAVAPGLMLTTRHHPLRSADVVHSRILGGVELADTGDALGLVLEAVADVVAGQIEEVAAVVQKAEDDFLDERTPASTREHLALRRRAATLHRQLGGQRNVLTRIERDRRVAPVLAPVIARFAQRLDGLDADVLGLLTQLRQIREELDLQASQRTNQNLYLLSIMTALMLPATLVTGFFGMNTGGLPLAEGGAGSFVAALVALGSAALAYVLLLTFGLARR